MKTMKELRIARNLAAVVVLTFGMSACTQNDEPGTDSIQAPHTAVNIMAGVQQGAATRVAGIEGNGFGEGTKITILDKNNATTKAVFTKGVDAAWTSETPLYWDDLTKDSGKETFSFVGIYPNDASLTYTVGDPNEILMAFADNQAAKSSEVQFDFKHVLSKLTLTIEPDATISSITSPVITLKGIKKSVTFNYENTDGFANFQLAAGEGEDYSVNDATIDGKNVTREFLVPAQLISALTFTATGLSEHTYKTIDLKQGQNLKLTLTLTKSGFVPKSVSVTDWTTDNKTGQFD